MADCKIVNESVKAAIDNIGGPDKGALVGIAKSFQDAGITFISSLHSAIAEMEGETRDALWDFIDNKVQPFVEEDLPNAINGLSVLLEANRSNFEDVDKQLAESISQG